VAESGGEGWREPKLARSLLTATFQLYRRYPLLFVTLALGVIGPYDLIILLATGTGPIGKGGIGLSYPITAFLVSPLVSALHIHAVAEVRAGRTPRLSEIARRGLLVLPTAAATAIMMTLGVLLGFLLLIVPGILLGFRWYVAVQAAAIEHEGWLPALSRSRVLTQNVYGHIFAFALLIGLVAEVPLVIANSAVTGHDTLAGPFIAGVVVHTFAVAFTALATALLYFDLADRQDEPRTPLG
jgi:hypothetical protein